MNKLEDSFIKYQIDFEKYKNGQANEIIKLFDDANNEIAKYLKRTTDVPTKKRYKEIAKKLKEVSKALKNKVAENTDVDGLIDYEFKKQRHLLGLSKKYVRKTKGNGKFNFIYPTAEKVKTSVMFKPVTDGFTYDSYLDGIESGLFNTWDAAVRTGYLTGMPTKEVVENVMGGISPATKLKSPGLVNHLRNSIYGNTRTLLQSFANETRNRVFEANEQYFGDGVTDYKYEYLSTLDARTCIMCGSCGGKLYKTLKDCPQIPQHRGCRCIILPYFNIKGETRASKDGYVDADTSFSSWLAEQDEETQKDVLGKTRYNLYKRGEPIDQFVDNGRVLTLEELAKTVFYSDGIEAQLFNKIPAKEMMNSILEKEVEVINRQNYINDVKDGVYQMNCAQCCHAIELRYRGYDVIAKPLESATLNRGYNFLKVFDGYEKNLKPLNDNVQEKAVKQMLEWGNGSRAEIRISTSSNNIFGHVFTAVNDNGNIVFIDSQQGLVDVKSIFKRVRGDLNFIVKVDDLAFTESIKYYVENRSK